MRLLIAVFVVIGVYSLQLKLYRKYWNRGLSIDLSFSKDMVPCGEKVELVEVIGNDKMLALPILNVKFATSRSFLFDEEINANVSDRYYRNDIFSVLGNQRIERRLKFVTTARGIFRIKELQVSTKDLFLKHPFANIMNNSTELIVFPKRIPMEQYVKIRNQMMGEYEVNRWDNPDPFAFRGIRPYQTFDGMGSINWKATARFDELMVNQYCPTTKNEVRIYLNLRPYMKSQAYLLAEHAISIISTIAADFISLGINVSFYTNGWDVEAEVNDQEEPDISKHPTLTAGGGRAHMTALDIMLSRIDIRKKASDFMDILNKGFDKAADQITHIIVSTYRDDELYMFYEQHYNTGSVCWIVPEREGNEVDLRFPGMYVWNA